MAQTGHRSLVVARRYIRSGLAQLKRPSLPAGGGDGLGTRAAEAALRQRRAIIETIPRLIAGD
jgi:hypothetical protein